MRDEYALDRRANELYDAAMRHKRNGEWYAYADTMLALDNVYAQIRAENMAYYPKSDRTPRIERIKNAGEPTTAKEMRRIEDVMEILRREGEVTAAKVTHELRCARSTVYYSLYYLEAWGKVDRSTRGIWRLIQDESA